MIHSPRQTNNRQKARTKFAYIGFCGLGLPHTLIYGIKPTPIDSVGVNLYSIGCVQKVSKFQNPEIKANAFYLYVFFCYLIIGNRFGYHKYNISPSKMQPLPSGVLCRCRAECWVMCWE